MKTYKHKNHTVYRLTKKIFYFKQHRKMQFWFEGKIVKNHRFIIKNGFWFIRLPYFYLEKNNGGFYIGTPNRYLQFQ